MPDLPLNARACVLLEPMWAIPGTVVMYYATLYMTTAGLDPVQIGLIVSVGLYVACFFQLAAGALTNKMGRRRATFVFDVLSWVIPMFLWAVAADFWMFLLACLLNATSRVVNVSFSLLATEDASAEQRPRIFAALKLIITAAGLLAPLAGLLMVRFGTMPTLRGVYFFGGLLMLAHVVVRYRLTTETATGSQVRQANGAVGVARGVRQGVRLFLTNARSREMWPIVAVYALTYLAWQVNIFQVVYLAAELNFGAAEISYLPALTAVVVLACYLVVMPRIRARPAEQNMFAALLCSASGWLIFLVVPQHGLVLLAISTVLTAAGLFLVESYRDALVVSRLPEHDRADLFSGIQTVTAVLAIPSGYLTALVYTYRPSLVFLAICALYALAAGLTMLVLAQPRLGQSWSSEG
jgi:MFS family permease